MQSWQLMSRRWMRTFFVVASVTIAPVFLCSCSCVGKGKEHIALTGSVSMVEAIYVYENRVVISEGVVGIASEADSETIHLVIVKYVIPYVNKAGVVLPARIYTMDIFTDPSDVVDQDALQKFAVSVSPEYSDYVYEMAYNDSPVGLEYNY